ECTDGEGNILYRLGSTGIANILKVTEGDASIDVSYTYVWDNFDLQGLEEVTYVYLRGDKWVTLHDSHEGDLAYLRFTDEELRRIGFCLDQAPEEVFESLKYVVAAGYTPGRLGEASVGGIIELVGRKDPVTGEKIFEIPEEALIARTLKGLAVEGYELDITMNHEIGHHRHYVAEKNDQEQQAWSAFEDLHVKSGEDPYNYLDAYNLSPDENPYGESSSYEDFATIFSFFMSYTDQLFQEAVARASRGHTVLLEKVIMMSYFFLNDDGRSISAGKYDYVLDTIVSKSWPITLYRGSLVIGDFVFELDENNYILSATRSSGEVTEFGVTSSINCSHLLGTLTEPDNSFLLDEVFLDAAWQYQSKNTVPGGVKLLESSDFGNEPWDPGSFSSGLMYPFPGNKPRQDTPVRHFPDIDKGLRDTAGNFRKGVRDILLGQGHIAEEDVVREVCVNVDIFPVITKDNESLVETILETVALKQERLDRLTGKEKIRFVLRSLSGDSEKEERIKNMYSKLRVSQEYEGRQEVIAGFAISDLSEEYDYGKYRLLALKSKLFDEDQGGFYNIPLLLDLSVILTLLAGKEDHDKFHNVINGILKASGNSPISEANLDILLGNDIRESLTLSRKIAIKPVSRFAFGDLVILHEYCLEFEKQA
ncbi:MAG TPA: hypothetical protein PKZ41_03070, partial [Candidatus Omnitrophota bacterium]|nr:hypothetical protein [Candidatus Omnitrophota bacterium]